MNKSRQNDLIDHSYRPSMLLLLLESRAVYDAATMVPMTKGDIVDNLCEQVGGFSKKEAADLVESVFSSMKGALEAGEAVKISGFGNFEVRQKNSRRGRNPQTGQQITIEARRVLAFRPSTVLKTALNEES